MARSLFQAAFTTRESVVIRFLSPYTPGTEGIPEDYLQGCFEVEFTPEVTLETAKQLRKAVADGHRSTPPR